jgi:hypothetical protein
MPYSPSGFPSDFDAAQNAALRKRRLAQMLQDQAFKANETGLNVPGAKMSVLNPIAQMVQAYAGMKLGKDADTADADNATARQDALTKLLSEMPQGTPAVPGELASPDVVGPPRPEQPAVPPTPQDMIGYGSKFLPLGPAAAKIGQQFTDSGVNAMIPKAPPGLMSVGGDIFDPTKGTFITGPSTLARIAETKSTNEQRATDKAAERARLEDAAAQISADRRYTVDQNNAARRDLHTALRGGEAGMKFGAPEGASEAGNVVLRGKDGVPHEVINGVPSPQPYAGAITPGIEQRKSVGEAAKGEQGIKDMESALKDIKDDPKLYGGRVAVGALFPDAMGIATAAGGLSAEQVAKRSKIQSMTAQTTHSLYGSAFSAGEQQRANKFLITPRDSAKDAQAKLIGRLEMEKEHYDALPASAKAAMTARKGGGEAAGGVDDLVNQYKSK